MAVTVDTRRFRQRMTEIQRATAKAQRRAKRDAAKQTRTAMSRDVGKTINLPARRIKDKITIRRRRGGDRQEVRTRYQMVPAHQFRGWSYTKGGRGGIVRETATRQTIMKRTSNVGLKVRFYKGKPAIVFRKAFRTARVGGGKVFLQRVGRERYPLTPIAGPPPWGVVNDKFTDYVNNGAAIYARRLNYWLNRELRKLQ